MTTTNIYTNEKLLEIAEEILPDGTCLDALFGQWTHAIKNGQDLYAPKKHKDTVRSILNFEAESSPPRSFTFIDLFSGLGGFRLAAESLGGQCVFSSDIDHFARETYKANFGDIPFGDVTKVDESYIPDHDVLFAGFPCQPFSYSGQNKGFDDETKGTLFYDVLRIARSKKPKVLLLENVKGLKSHQKGRTMETALNSLQESGYAVDWHILNSKDFGVPQFRERWFCVAVRHDTQLEKSLIFMNPDYPECVLEDILEDTLGEEDLEKVRLSDFEVFRIMYHFQNAKSRYDRVEHDNSGYGKNTKKGRHGVFSYQKPDGSLRFHVGDYAKTQIQEAFYTSIRTYTPTILANRVPKILELKRRLTVREAFRLQGFPDSYVIPVSDAQAYKQAGNSVTVSVSESILRHINVSRLIG